MVLTFGIIGNGFVGQATKILKSSEVDMLIYDISPEKCDPIGTTLEELSKCDIIFISVPTPMDKNGKNYMGIVTSVVNQLKSIASYDKMKNHIVIRSTVLPGLSSKMDCFFMPEFLTEKNWPNDFYNCQNWIFGLLDTENDERNKAFQEKITKLIDFAWNEDKIKYKNCLFVKNEEAEMIKYFRNTFLALKVSYSNEMYDYCQAKGINYDIVQSIGSLDPRIGESHTKVPGHDGKRGFGGTCFPKDTSALLRDFEDSNIPCFILKGAVERNNKIDRNEQDWLQDKGRAFLDVL